MPGKAKGIETANPLNNIAMARRNVDINIGTPGLRPSNCMITIGLELTWF